MSRHREYPPRGSSGKQLADWAMLVFFRSLPDGEDVAVGHPGDGVPLFQLLSELLSGQTDVHLGVSW
jgi:hypothetical protein